ncbi:TetR/AcrR family transcriptional regulator [Humibacter ginsenosidimutans]|uniref:TetR family transcriptional regulator n=1 Tax=Humibacter ginsenosidimutans TaxID=2599293 RepID=A0A5B8M6S0_9MICO|nr:TetR/AcrR family transcriptional regulator [Humibacter ginsenosidimutans]QDZ15684.1 TetR family transcriptional regulator [Humibacter ginsenosidimutans]
MRTNTEAVEPTVTRSARREQIVQAAIEVLAERGYASTSIAAIASDHLGVSKGVLSYHFDNKAELMGEVVRSVLRSAEEWMTPRIVGAASYHEALHQYIAANTSFLDLHRTEIAALTEILVNAQAIEGVPELFAQSQTAARTALESLFDGGRSVGEFGDTPSVILAMSLRATIDAASERLRTDPDFGLETFARDLMAMFDRAVAPAPRGKAAMA